MEASHNQHSHQQDHPYRKLIIMALLSFVSMYALMYAMVDRFANVLPNINQFYMAGLMAAPMMLIELVVMSSMYPNKKRNAIIMAVSAVALVAFFFAIRQQVGVSDRQFVRSMIPHHAGAILMCEGADLKDPKLKELCRTIVEGQQAEIEQMKESLKKQKQD